MPDDHSEVVPLLPIPNRTVKRLSADDSAGSRVKVGHRQALTAPKSPTRNGWAFCFLMFQKQDGLLVSDLHLVGKGGSSLDQFRKDLGAQFIEGPGGKEARANDSEVRCASNPCLPFIDACRLDFQQPEFHESSRASQ